MKKRFGSEIKPIVKKSTKLSKYLRGEVDSYNDIDKCSVYSLIHSIELLIKDCKAVLDEREELILDFGVMDTQTRNFTSDKAFYLRLEHDELHYTARRLGKSLKIMEMYGLDPNEEDDLYPQ
jgi:hypothetical protein